MPTSRPAPPLPHQHRGGPGASCAQLRGALSGLAQPTYVLDIPGGHGKVPIGPGYVSADGGSVIDPSGALHRLSRPRLIHLLRLVTT